MKVLVIDDDKFIRTVYATKLKAEKFEVDVAADGEEGFEKVKSFKPDLILLDIMMGEKDGFGVLEKLKESKNKIPVVVFSSLSQQSDIDKAKQLGSTKYMPKDQNSVSEIIDEIKKMLK